MPLQGRQLKYEMNKGVVFPYALYTVCPLHVLSVEGHGVFVHQPLSFPTSTKRKLIESIEHISRNFQQCICDHISGGKHLTRT